MVAVIVQLLENSLTWFPNFEKVPLYYPMKLWGWWQWNLQQCDHIPMFYSCSELSSFFLCYYLRKTWWILDTWIIRVKWITLTFWVTWYSTGSHWDLRWDPLYLQIIIAKINGLISPNSYFIPVFLKICSFIIISTCFWRLWGIKN